MKEKWTEFEHWLKIHSLAAFSCLNSPATDEQIARLEKALFVKLPQDFIAFLHIHNGQKNNSKGLVNGSELLSCERIIDEWGIWNDLLALGEFKDNVTQKNNGVKSDWWNPKWIPFTHDGFGNHLCLDLDPDTNGHFGQVITMWHDDAKREVKAPSFALWFENFVNKLA